MSEKSIIKHSTNNVVYDILINGKSILNSFDSQIINFNFDGLDALNHKVELPDNLIRLFADIFELCCKLDNKGKHYLAANTATFLYERFTELWATFLKNGQHFIAIKLWDEIIAITLKWEEQEKKHIHKGTPYGILARTHLSMGNGYSAFNSLYKALDEDLILGRKAVESGYPDIAPSFLTVTLNPSKSNFMQDCVVEVRKYIQSFIHQYNIETKKDFSIALLDRNFLQRRSLEPLNFFFANTIWTIFEYRRRVNPVAMANDFALLKNPELFFSLCLVINDLLNIINNRKNNMRKAIIGYIRKRQWKIKIADLDKNSMISEGLPNEIVPDLLNYYHPQSKNILSKELSCLLLAWNIRNFSGHNIQPQAIFADKFDEILKMLLFAIFFLIEDIY